jgi:hypothetical protein
MVEGPKKACWGSTERVPKQLRPNPNPKIVEHLLNRKCLENGDTLFIARPANLKIRCFIFVVMDTFKFSVCSKSAVQILTMSEVRRGVCKN